MPMYNENDEVKLLRAENAIFQKQIKRLTRVLWAVVYQSPEKRIEIPVKLIIQSENKESNKLDVDYSLIDSWVLTIKAE